VVNLWVNPYLWVILREAKQYSMLVGAVDQSIFQVVDAIGVFVHQRIVGGGQDRDIFYSLRACGFYFPGVS
jgi:hypothetical protein